MKDTFQQYDPRVAEILGFDPNDTQFGIPTESREPIINDTVPVNFDIGLEFGKRIRAEFTSTEELYDINSAHLLKIRVRNEEVERTYYSHLPHVPAQRQEFTPLQSLQFTKTSRGKYMLSGIHLVNPHNTGDRPWTTFTATISDELTTLEALSEKEGRSIRIEYLKDQPPIVLLNEKPLSAQDRMALMEGDDDWSVFEYGYSSVILPNTYQRGLVQVHMGFNSDLLQFPWQWQDISDKGMHKTKDPLSAARIRWIP